jgi:hypothetical protein
VLGGDVPASEGPAEPASFDGPASVSVGMPPASVPPESPTTPPSASGEPDPFELHAEAMSRTAAKRMVRILTGLSRNGGVASTRARASSS